MVSKLKILNDGIPELVDFDALSSANAVLKNIPCDNTVFVGSFVRMTSGGSAINAIADSVLNSNVIGIVELKPTNTSCNIRIAGFTSSIFSGLDVSKLYYLSETNAGQLTINPPSAQFTVRQVLGKPFSSTKFLVLIGNDPLLN